MSCYVIDTFDEHFELILSAEKGLEELRGSSLPFRSQFEKFIPYVHINENFKFLSLESEGDDKPIENEFLAHQRREKLKKLDEERRLKRAEIKFEIQNRYYELLEKAVLVYEFENCRYRLSKTGGACGFCPAEAVRGTALDCLRNIVFLSEFGSGSCISDSISRQS